MTIPTGTRAPGTRHQTRATGSVTTALTMATTRTKGTNE